MRVREKTEPRTLIELTVTEFLILIALAAVTVGSLVYTLIGPAV